jgi:hypothetical protein
LSPLPHADWESNRKLCPTKLCASGISRDKMLRSMMSAMGSRPRAKRAEQQEQEENPVAIALPGQENVAFALVLHTIASRRGMVDDGSSTKGNKTLYEVCTGKHRDN